MQSKSGISFGDNVRMRTTPETEKIGVAGKVGNVYGETTPSVSGVEVIGQITDDYAVNVHFDELNNSYWFVEELVEFVDHAAGVEMSIKGGPSFVRAPNGEWIEQNKSVDTKRWWQFWRK